MDGNESFKIGESNRLSPHLITKMSVRQLDFIKAKRDPKAARLSKMIRNAVIDDKPHTRV